MLDEPVPAALRHTVLHASQAAEHPAAADCGSGGAAAWGALGGRRRVAVVACLLLTGCLLPDANGPSAQLMYQNGGGQRVTVYLRKPGASTDMAFRFQRDGELGLFYWVEDGFGCSVVGKLPREQLLAVAEAVYKQAEASIVPTPVSKLPAS